MGRRLSDMGRFRLYFCTTIGCWALVLMPALCVGGVLMHPCDCPHSQDADHQEKESCGHEAECATDPCGTVVTRPSDGHDDAPNLDAFAFASPLTSVLIDPRVLTPISWSSPPGRLGLATVFDALASTILLI